MDGWIKMGRMNSTTKKPLKVMSSFNSFLHSKILKLEKTNKKEPSDLGYVHVVW